MGLSWAYFEYLFYLHKHDKYKNGLGLVADAGGVSIMKVSHSTQPEVLGRAIASTLRKNRRAALQLTFAFGGQASWRAMMGVAAANVELGQKTRGALQLGVLVTKELLQLADGGSRWMCFMRVVKVEINAGQGVVKGPVKGSEAPEGAA
jgi:hypothetical protein